MNRLREITRSSSVSPDTHEWGGGIEDEREDGSEDGSQDSVGSESAGRVEKVTVDDKPLRSASKLEDGNRGGEVNAHIDEVAARSRVKGQRST